MTATASFTLARAPWMQRCSTAISSITALVLLAVAGCSEPPTPIVNGTDEFPRCSTTGHVLYLHSQGTRDTRPTGLYCFHLDSLRSRMLVPGVCWYDWIPGTDSLIVTGHFGTREISFRTGEGRDLPWSATPGRISPDGSRMAHDPGDRGRRTVSLMNLATGETRSITPDSMLYAWPSWSPSGDRLAVIAGSAHVSGVFIIDTTGAPRRQLTGELPNLRPPEWSPRGDAIAWIHASSIHIIDTLGTNPRYVGKASHVCWGPDGDALIFTGWIRGGTRLFEYRLSTGRTRQLTF